MEKTVRSSGVWACREGVHILFLVPFLPHVPHCSTALLNLVCFLLLWPYLFGSCFLYYYQLIPFHFPKDKYNYFSTSIFNFNTFFSFLSSTCTSSKSYASTVTFTYIVPKFEIHLFLNYHLNAPLWHSITPVQRCIILNSIFSLCRLQTLCILFLYWQSIYPIIKNHSTYFFIFPSYDPVK